MSITVLIPANTFRLTTIGAVMAEIPLSDQLLFAESLIDQASAAVARHCRTIFAQQKYREVQTWMYAHDPTRYLRYTPLASVSLVLDGVTAITDYRIESAKAGMLYRRNGWWVSSYDADWTFEYIAGYILPEQTSPPDATGPYLRGAADDLERATIETIKVWFHERLVSERVQGKTFGLTGDSVQYGVQAERRGLPSLAKDLLKPWCPTVVV